MHIRDFMTIVEGSMLSEANWKMAYAYAYRSWYNVETKEWIKVEGMASHARTVARNPEQFGITCNMDDKWSCTDSDPYVMNAAFEKGWIRVAGQDRQNPQTYMIIEGADLKQCLRLAKQFLYDMNGELENLGVKVRTLNGDEGLEYLMIGNAAVKAGLMRGELPEPKRIGSEGEAL